MLGTGKWQTDVMEAALRKSVTSGKHKERLRDFVENVDLHQVEPAIACKSSPYLETLATNEQ